MRHAPASRFGRAAFAEGRAQAEALSDNTRTRTEAHSIRVAAHSVQCSAGVVI